MPKGFEKLRKEVQEEYKERGYTTEEAKRIGYATANKIENMKNNHKRHY